jgi:hypothetical protein
MGVESAPRGMNLGSRQGQRAASEITTDLRSRAWSSVKPFPASNVELADSRAGRKVPLMATPCLPTRPDGAGEAGRG